MLAVARAMGLLCAYSGAFWAVLTGTPHSLPVPDSMPVERHGRHHARRHHQVPAVRYALRPTAGPKAVVAALLFSTLIFLALGVRAGLSWGAAWAAGAVALGSAGFALRTLGQPSEGCLQFDGERWLGPQGASCSAWRVRLDGGRFLWVERVDGSGPRWLWLSCSFDPEHWGALRRAIVATARRQEADHG